jgi:hypothetical protein
VNVISFSLFGTDGTYSVGAVENVCLYADLFPEWLCRFYVGDSIPAVVVDEFDTLGADIVPMPGVAEDWHSTFWRFRSLTSDLVDVHLFRDCDSRPDERERAAVDEWLASGREFHVMRDHPEHGMPILAGMWGCTRAGAQRIRHLLPREHGPVERYLADQMWLRDHVYPIAVDHALIHSSPESPRFDDDARGDLRDWPTRRQPNRFVGQGFHADGTPRIPADALRV